ncbi:hypothetical protein F4604DRAFT_1949758 [Suillus subluteus]|nr:hypothetical protein F4604DRAFT_1949758 [Suillus subluteus]
MSVTKPNQNIHAQNAEQPVYCSVGCYKRHKESCGSTETSAVTREAVPPSSAEETLDDPMPLRPLTSLNWPYVPEESAYPDPLKRDDPRPIQLHQYEAIATSAAYKLRGADREDALHRALGVDTRQLKNDLLGPQRLDDDTKMLRQLAEAVEAAVRGGKRRSARVSIGTNDQQNQMVEYARV